MGQESLRRISRLKQRPINKNLESHPSDPEDHRDKMKPMIQDGEEVHASYCMWGPVQCSRCCALPMPPRPECSHRQSRMLADGRYCLFTGSPKGLPFEGVRCPHTPTH